MTILRLAISQVTGFISKASIFIALLDNNKGITPVPVPKSKPLAFLRTVTKCANNTASMEKQNSLLF